MGLIPGLFVSPSPIFLFKKGNSELGKRSEPVLLTKNELIS